MNETDVSLSKAVYDSQNLSKTPACYSFPISRQAKEKGGTAQTGPSKSFPQTCFLSQRIVKGGVSFPEEERCDVFSARDRRECSVRSCEKGDRLFRVQKRNNSWLGP